MLGLPEAVALWLGVGSAAVLQTVQLLHRRHRRRRNVVSSSTSIHRDLGQRDPVASLGLHRSELAAREAVAPVDEASLPPYIRGTIDEELADALAQSQFVLITGGALAGKSRAAYEAVSRTFPRSELWVPAGAAGLRKLLSCDPPLPYSWRDVVVWLDNLHDYIDPPTDSTGEQVSAALFRRHLAARRGWNARRRARLVFVATMPTRRYRELMEDCDETDGSSPRLDAAAILRLAEVVELGDGRDAGWDMNQARTLYPTIDFSAGVGRDLAQAELINKTYRRGSNSLGQAVLRAAVDWQRIRAGPPSRSDLNALVRAAAPGTVIPEAELERALVWANRAIAGGQRLLVERTERTQARYEVHPYLIELDDGDVAHCHAREVAFPVWGIALERLEAPVLLEVGLAGLRYDQYMAARIWTSVAEDRSIRGSTPDTRAVAYVRRGELREMQGYEGSAEADYTRAIEIESAAPPIQANTYILRGELRARQPGRQDGAEADYTAVMNLAGVSSDVRAGAYYSRGNLRMEHAGREEESEADFTAAIGMTYASPATRGPAYVHRGRLRSRQPGREAEAEADYTAAIELDGIGILDLATGYHNRGNLRAKQDGREDEAEADYLCAIQFGAARPEVTADAHYQLSALLFDQAGREDEADEHLTAAIELATTSRSRARYYRARGSLRSRNPDRVQEAEADYTDALEVKDVEPAIRAGAYLGRGLVRMRRRGKAAKDAADQDLSAALDTPGAEPGTQARAYMARGRVRRVERVHDAEHDLTVAIGMDGSDPETLAGSHIERGDLRWDQGRISEAEADFTAGLAIESTSAHLRAVGLFNRGSLRSEQAGGATGAEADFRAAIALPDAEVSAEALRALADLLRSHGRREDLEELYLAAIKSRRAELVSIAQPILGGPLSRVRAQRSARRLFRMFRLRLRWLGRRIRSLVGAKSSRRDNRQSRHDV